MASNDTALLDGDGESSDWIELHNAGDEALDLAGWHMTDDHAALDKWTFPAEQPELTVLQPGQYLVIFASGQHADEDGQPNEAYVDLGGHLHANFRIRANGEYLALVGPEGVVAEYGSGDEDFPEQYTDISYGLPPRNQREPVYFLEPTPGAANKDGVEGIVTAEVEYSQAGQNFIEPFDLTLSAETGTIRYTLDGSVPTVTSTEFSGAIRIQTTTQVRARVFEPNRGPGPVHSESFIQLATEVVAFQSPLPILVIENFDAGRVPNKRAHNPPAGDGGGIKQVERQFAHLQFFEPDGEMSSLNQTADLATRSGIRVRGSSSANFRKKSLSVEAWGETDDDDNIRPLGMPSESDWILYAPSAEFDRTLLHNSFAYELSRQIGRYAVRFQFVEVFLNTSGGALSMNDHQGVYIWMEKVKRDADRVDVERMSADGREGGWLLQSNRMQAVPVDGTEHPPNFHTKGPNRRQQGPYGRTFTGGTDRGGDDVPTGYNTFLNFESPRGEEINSSQIDAIASWFGEFEDALYSAEFADPEKGYRAFLDVGSFIDHALLTNLTLSFDALQLSTYMFRRSESDKMELGPIWDFDRAYGADSRAADPTTNLTYTQRFLWMPRLFEDPDFAQAYQDRWQELRAGPFSTTNLHAIIDRQAAEITQEVAEANGTRDWPAKLQAMKDWLAARAEAIDELYIARPQFKPPFAVPGSTADLIKPSATAYYTKDGSDPRAAGGQVAPNAIEATGGMGQTMTFVAEDSRASAIVPDGSFHAMHGLEWNGQDPNFDDSAAAGWKQGTMGIGFDERDTYQPLIGLDLRTEMSGINGSFYSRVEFTMDDLATDFDFLALNMRYDDGFIAYLNGVEIARANALSDATWDSVASRPHRDSNAQEFEVFDVSAHSDFLRRGQNVLAIHGMNRRVTDSDLLIQAELVAGNLPRTSIQIDVAEQLVARSFENGDWSGPTVLEVARPGDANGDGRFSSSDLVLVFRAGEYEDGVADNSEFIEGDWDGDGDFTTTDLVLAFQEGHYVAAATVAHSIAGRTTRLPSAIDWVHEERSLDGSLLTEKFRSGEDLVDQQMGPRQLGLQELESIFAMDDRVFDHGMVQRIPALPTDSDQLAKDSEIEQVTQSVEV